MNQSPKNILMIFLKYPEKGYVKTRLAKDIGIEEAADIYRELCEGIIKNTYSTDYQQLIVFAPEDKYAEIKIWLGPELNYHLQSDGDLGARLSTAFECCFHTGASAVIAIGSDTPDISKGEILHAFKQLNSYDVAIGPCLDGGYYLLGLKKALYDANKSILGTVFKNIKWSTNKVYRATMSRLKREKISVAVLSKKRDIDTIKDFEAWLTV